MSHEIAHILRHDWARRYLYEQSLQSNGSATIVLNDPGLPSSSWTDAQKASENLAQFCRKLEIDADREGLGLMARAGYHPHFVPALHHLLHALTPTSEKRTMYAMHPCWEERDQELSRAYLEASIDFEHRWPEWYASPGGNPPVVVFTEKPSWKKNAAKQWELQIPLRCENLAGAIEVILREGSALGSDAQEVLAQPSQSDLRQLTGCTHPKDIVTFSLPGSLGFSQQRKKNLNVYVLDSWGALLARTELMNP